MTKLSTERKNMNSQKADCVHPNVAFSVILENNNEFILKITIFILHSRQLRTFTIFSHNGMETMVVDEKPTGS